MCRFSHLKQQYYISIDIDSYILFWNLHRLIILEMADFMYSSVYLIKQFTEESVSKISFHVILHFTGLSTTIKGHRSTGQVAYLQLLPDASYTTLCFYWIWTTVQWFSMQYHPKREARMCAKLWNVDHSN